MRVLLVKARNLRARNTSHTPPLGVLSLAAYLRQHLAAEVRVVDVERMADPDREVAEAVRAAEPDLVGVSGITCEAPMLHRAAELARGVRPGVPVIVGGPYPSSDPDAALADANIDAAVLGEGEETLLEVARLVREQGRAWSAPDALAAVRGLAWRAADGLVRRSAPRPPIADLDALPIPAWDAIDVGWYWRRRSMSTCGVRPYLPVFTSRGCPYRCTYCHNLFGRTFRARSAESVLDELAHLHRTYGVNDFELLDDSVNIDRARFIAILTGLLERGLHPKLNFPNGVRTDLLDDEQIRLLHRVGVGEISVAVETASPRLQKRTRKNLDLERVRHNIERMADLRIFTRGFFMLGYPTETEAELLSTIDYAARSRLHLASFNITNPFPGTPIHAEFAALGKLLPDVDPGDFEYERAPFNGSEVSDPRFQQLFRLAYLRFYGRPGRVLRILRDRPYRTGYAAEAASLLSKFASFSRLREVLRS
jgi:radical SAM superfamily enzyme YgiQ (UPF0313 family)